MIVSTSSTVSKSRSTETQYETSATTDAGTIPPRVDEFAVSIVASASCHLSSSKVYSSQIQAINQGSGLGLEGAPPTLRVPQNLGFVHVPIDFTRQEDPKILREANPLGNRTRTPELSRDNEAWVRHHIWKEFFGAIREGVIPNPASNTEQRIDVMGFEGTTDPSEIYEAQDEGNIIGIEAKPAGIGSQKAVRSQLERYLSCGGLTALYLAVCKQDKQNARDLLTEQPTLDSFASSSPDSASGANRSLADVGLITVDSAGMVEFVQQATQFCLQYDGLQTKDTHGKCKAVGWGQIKIRDCSEFHAVFRQADSPR